MPLQFAVHPWARCASVLAAAAVLMSACAPSAAPASNSASAPAAKAPATLDQLVAAAKAEGKLNIAGPSNLGEDGFQALVAAMNERYGTNIQGTFTSGGNLQEIVAKVITERAAGGKPTWDSVLLNDSYVASLSEEGQLAQHPYTTVFTGADKAVGFDGTAIAFANQLALPVVNTKLVSPAEQPKTWDDLLDPKWKGKIGVHNAVHHFVRLSQVWGDEKTTDFLTKLSAQEPKIGLINETYKRLVLGETLISATQTNSQLDTGRAKGEPVDWAMNVRPAIAPTYYCSAVKDAPNPSTSMLFCGFMLEQAARDVWGEKVGRQSIHDPSTELGKIYAQDPKGVLTWDDKFSLNEFQARDKKYREIVGFR